MMSAFWWLVACLLVLQWSQCHGQVNRAPYFLPGSDMARFSLPENTPVGTSVYTLQGVDPEGSTVHYSISGDHFTVDKKSGVVTLLRPLDRETQDLLEVIISITDEKLAGIEPNTVSLRREIPVLDVNDNPPVFQNRPYAFTLAETSDIGSVVFANISITDADGGVNADIKLKCMTEKSPEACSVFGVSSEKFGEGDYIGILRLLSPLDFERRSSYNLVLLAQDSSRDISSRLSATANVVVEVKDIQDQPPIFLNAPYSATVPEGTAEGTSILTINSRDGDTGEPRSILLTLEGDEEGYFELQQTNVTSQGVVSAVLRTSAKPLDRENAKILQNGGIYTFQVKATEMINNELFGEEATSTITIVVTDMDDQIPVFSKENFHINVSEDIGKDTPLPGLNLVVQDTDVGDNAKYFLKLINVKNSEGVFSVYPSSAIGRTPVIIRVGNTDMLDYENSELREFIFDVAAVVDGRIVSKSRITVNLVDANDNAPSFKSSSYNFKVSETVKPGSLITELRAMDPDSETFGKILYSVKGFGAEKFRVDKDTGELFVAECSQETCLDYETQKSYSLTYTATDGGGRISTVSVVIEVEDVNDNRPMFEQRDYRRTLREGSSIFEPQLFIKATDIDGPDQGDGKVFYKITSSNAKDNVFFIEPVSGEIKMNRPVRAADTPNGQYELKVQATDGGKPPLHSEVNVYIHVGIDGNQRPIFRNEPYNATVKENTPVGMQVFQSVATDPDGLDSQLTYFIAGGARDNFVIDSKSGKISIAPEANLDLDKNGREYAVVIHAVDSGTPYQETGTATVIINVEDVNNKPPVFSKESYVRYISESVVVGESILNVTATDPDSDAKLEYKIIEPIRAADKTGVNIKSTVPYNYKTAFSINSTTGTVTIAQPLDHQSTAVIIFTVEARDVQAVEDVENQVAVAEVTIYIQAYSDSNPVFALPWTPSNPIVRVNVPEEQEIGTTLLTLSAKDPLTGKAIQRFEEVPGSDDHDFVSVGSKSGNIILNKKLDFESMLEKSISFQIRAVTEDGGTRRASVATVVVNIEDVNDNNPEFARENYKTRILESAKHPEPVITIRANDKDTNLGYGSIRYSLSGEGSDLFVIDPVSGVMQVAPNATLDRERQATMNLLVLAVDTPAGGANQRKSSALVTIDVLDVNDNAPSFSEKAYSAVVPENVPVGFSVTQIRASDADEGESGVVEYELLDEGEINGLFEIHNATGVISTKKPLTGKGRQEPYMLVVRGQDHGAPQLFSDAQLNIFIGDVSTNDGVPMFVKPTLNEIAYVSENSSIGSPVFQVVATDADDPNTPNGRIIYKFLDDGKFGINSVAFTINSDSGLITTKKLLDRENKENYTLIIVAQDLGNPPQQSSRVLQVNVRDIDDHKPMFKRRLHDEPILMKIAEEIAIGAEVGTVSAIDEDIGENGLVDYLITYGNEDGFFEISRTSENKGKITVAKRVDREISAEHLLTVKCFKASERPPSLRRPYRRQDPSEVQVRILVQDIDDNNPEFLQNNITLGVRLNVPVNTALVTLHAIDADADATPMKYEIVEASFFPLNRGERKSGTKVFQVDQHSGEIRTSDSLAGFIDGYFLLEVKAFNTDAENKSAHAHVKVFVLRDRDLLKFVFNKPPTEVRKILKNFQQEVEKALLLPVSVNIYDTQFYAKHDGSLDFSSTSSCFQLVGKEIYELDEMQSLMDDPNNLDLDEIYRKYDVHAVEKCAPQLSKSDATWIELWVLAIACFIGLAALIAGIVICCLYSRYKHQLSRSRMHIVESPYMAQSYPPGSVIMAPSVMGSEGMHLYDWQDGGGHLDAVSYHGFPH